MTCQSKYKFSVHKLAKFVGGHFVEIIYRKTNLERLEIQIDYWDGW